MGNQPPRSRIRLTQRYIASLPTLGRDYLVSDDELPKLKVKVTRAGRKSFLLRYRNEAGLERKYKLGDVPDINVAQARRLAQQLLPEIAQGEDPATGRHQRRKGLTLNDVAERFLEEYGALHLRTSTLRDYRLLLRREIEPELGRKTLATITREDVLQLQKALYRTPTQANRTLNLIRRLFNWATENGLHPEHQNPATRIKRYTEQQRQQLLSVDEQKRLATILNQMRVEMPNREPSIDAILFMFFTGCRRGEALGLRWSEVDFERGQLHFLGAKTGDRSQSMSADLRLFLEGIKSRSDHSYVFPGRRPDAPLTDIKNTWSMVRTRAGLPRLRLHDIRHNRLSAIAAATDVATAAAIGGHKSIRSTMRYIHAQDHATRAALEIAGREVAETFLTKDDET